MTKAPKKPAISVRPETFDKLRTYARSHGVQIRSVVDDLVNAAIDEAERRAKEGN